MNELELSFSIGKLEAAIRQLVASITIAFEGGDPLVAHTLAGAAANLLTDIIKVDLPQSSWDARVQSSVDLGRQEYLAIMRRIANFLKHADKDRDAVLDFNPEETDAVTFWAVMNAKELGQRRPEFDVFQSWYLSWIAYDVLYGDSAYAAVLSHFGDLRGVPRAERLMRAAAFLHK
jgi:hypothetical protein